MKNDVICPIYFENHNFAGHLVSINQFINMDLGNIRTTIINGKPYFAGVDICRGLYLDPNKSSEYILEAVKDILIEYNTTPQTCYRGSELYNQNSLTPTFETGRSEINNQYNLTTLTELRGSDFIENRFERELYFYIDIEVSHSNGHSIVKQMVRTIFISEPVLYMLLFRSRKREAVRFKAWMAVEVLPNLRVLGREQAINLLNNEMTNIMNTINSINTNYDELKDSAQKNAAMLNGIYELASRNIQNQNINAAILDSKIADLTFRVDNVGFNSVDISNKITDIATGLNMIFGGKQ